MNQNSITESMRLPDSWKAKPFLLFVVGVAAMLGSLGLGFATQEQDKVLPVFLHSYLANYIYALSFGLGALFFVLIQFLCRAGWSASIREWLN